MKCYCLLRNVADVMHYGTTPYYARFGRFTGERIPLGASIGYMKFDRHVKAERDHPFAKKIFKGLFIGYDQRPGGSWSGDYWIVDEATLSSADSVHNVRPLAT